MKNILFVIFALALAAGCGNNETDMGKNKFCQSCGMPMKSDPQGGGTNADSTISEKYCSYCYVNGKFTFEGGVEEFQDFCKEKMVESGHNKFMAWLLTRNMKRLERWKEK